MALCENCICYESCKDWADQYEDTEFPYGKCFCYKPKSPWNMVEEGLPIKNGKYIVCNKSGAVYQTKFYTYPESKGGHWGQKDKGKNIIAWMPMPEVCLPFPMPKERKENERTID